MGVAALVLPFYSLGFRGDSGRCGGIAEAPLPKGVGEEVLRERFYEEVAGEMHEVEVKPLRGSDPLVHQHVAMERPRAHGTAGHPEVGVYEIEAFEAEVEGEEAENVVFDEGCALAGAENRGEGVVGG